LLQKIKDIAFLLTMDNLVPTAAKQSQRTNVKHLETTPTMYKKNTNKNEKSKDYCKADSEERVLFFL